MVSRFCVSCHIAIKTISQNSKKEECSGNDVGSFTSIKEIKNGKKNCLNFFQKIKD